MNELLDQAQTLLDTESFGIEQARQLADLEQQAKGEEADYIGELWEAVIARADADLLKQLHDEELI